MSKWALQLVFVLKAPVELWGPHQWKFFTSTHNKTFYNRTQDIDKSFTSSTHPNYMGGTLMFPGLVYFMLFDSSFFFKCCLGSIKWGSTKSCRIFYLERGSQGATKLQVALRKHSEERDHLGFQHFVQFFFSRELNFGHVEFDMPVG